jgi:hypothetical protein
MNSPIDEQWDFINPPTTMATIVTEQPSAPTPAPKIEVTINTKPTEKKEAKPKLARQNTDESLFTDSDVEVVRPRPARRSRRYSISPPPPRRFPSVSITPMLSSSTQLLENVNYDGIADMPFPGRSSIYLTTFPFTERDVKKWSWLFAHGVEDVWLKPGDKNAGDDDDDEETDEWFYDGGGRYLPPPRNVRNRRRDFDAGIVDVSSVYLSRALDTTVVPEDTDKKVKYIIVVQNRSKPSGGVKLLTAESRKAAGIALYYEALTGNSVVFVGAVVGDVGKKAKKFKKADSVDDAKVLTDGSVVGVIC